MRRPPAAVRYVLLHRLAFGLTALTVLVTAVATAASAAFATAAATAGNRRTLASNPASSVLADITSPPFARQSAAITRQLTASAPGLPMTFLTASQSDTLSLPAGHGGAKAETFLLDLEQFRQHARLVTGAWPLPARTGSGAIPACLPARAARLLGLSAGDTLTLRDSISHAPAQVEVACTFTARQPGSAFWQLDPVGPAGTSQLDGFTNYGPLITDAPPARWPVPVGNQYLLAEPDFGQMSAPNLATLGNSINNAITAMGSSQVLGANFTTSLPTLLATQAVALEVARSQLLIGLLIVLVMAAASLAVAVRMLSSQREGEPGLLMARGATRRQLARRGLADAAILAVPAAIAGPLIGIWLAPLVSRLSLNGMSSVQLPVTAPAIAWAAGIAVAAGCAVIIALPWLREPPSPVRQRAGRARQRSVTVALSSGADVGLILLAILAGWQLAGYSAPVTTGVSGSIGVDPILVFAPVLLLAAGTLIMLRLLPPLVRLAERTAARGRGITVPAAAWMVGRRTMRQAGPALLTVLAVATAVIALAEGASWRQSVHDQAGFTVGADTRVNLPPDGSLPIGQVADLTGARGVRAVTPVINLPFTAPGGTPATLLAVNGRTAQRIVPLRPDLAISPVTDPLRPITPAHSVSGTQLPGRPAELAVQVRLTGSAVTGASLAVQLTDAAGISYDLQAGTLTAGGAGSRLLIPIGGQADYPLTLTGFSLAYAVPEYGPDSKAALAIESVSSVSATGQLTPLAAIWPAGPPPTATVNVPQMAPWQGNSAYGDPSKLTLRRAGRGAVLSFLTGAGASEISSDGGFGSPSQTGATLTVASGAVETVPGIATSAFLAASGQHLGSVVQVNDLPVPVSVQIVGAVAQFPTITDSGGALIVDQPTLQAAVTDAGGTPLAVTQWWFSDAGRPAFRALPGGSTVTTIGAVRTSLTDQPLDVAPVQALTAVAIVALALAGLGCFVGVTAPKDRSRDLAVLDALGATPRQLTGLLCTEQAMLSVPAAGGGLALGLLLSRLIVPAVTLTPQASHPVPSVLVQVPLVAAFAVAAALAVAPVLAVALSMLRGTSTAARLRVEEET